MSGDPENYDYASAAPDVAGLIFVIIFEILLVEQESPAFAGVTKNVIPAKAGISL